ncbi:hypothetical protein GJ496_000120 [Pomphorhynchus laevis]|nr:hypothetical protein GJ496_000120 [Pomphorhynchus laevis]
MYVERYFAIKIYRNRRCSMRIREFRITLPLTIEEYHIGQLWCVAEFSKDNTGGGEGVEVLNNEHFDDKNDLLDGFSSGQYTKKIYHLASKVPWWVRKLAPTGSLEMLEEAWNAFPYCRTVITNPNFMQDKFFLKVETLHVADNGQSENVHHLTRDQLKKREVVYIDISHDKISLSDYKESEDPRKYKCSITGRGPLTDLKWRNNVQPVMTCYKLVTTEFHWFPFQTKIEDFIIMTQQRLYTIFNRQVFCTLHKWHGLTIQDIREIEEETKRELDRQRRQSQVKGIDGS